MVRRAVGDTYGRTFCLAGVDELDYEVARGVETVLETQCKGLSGKYHHKCFINNAFQQDTNFFHGYMEILRCYFVWRKHTYLSLFFMYPHVNVYGV